jgi:hypothetical protein
MLTHARHIALAFAVTLTCVATASAFTEAELIVRAQALLADYEDLQDRFEADVEPHSVLEAAYDALEVERLELEADRATLPGSCTCVQLDALIHDIQVVSAWMAATIGGWEDG